MGVYYYFQNQTTGEENSNPIPQNFGLTWMAKLDSYENEEIINIFESVRISNNWLITDVIKALPDENYHKIYRYTNNELTTEWDDQYSDDD